MLNQSAINAIEKILINHKYNYQKCKTWTTDGFYRETKEMVEYRKEEGFSVVEMACAYLESVLHNFMHGIRLKKAPLSK